MTISATMKELEILKVEIAVLKREHSDLNAMIDALQLQGSYDVLTIKRLKKQKLQLKDKIAVLADQIEPDIIA